MEVNPKDKTVPVSDQTKSNDPEDENYAYVSPDVAAAQAGEQVEMGKSVEEDPAPIPVVATAPEPEAKIVQVETSDNIEEQKEV